MTGFHFSAFEKDQAAELAAIEASVSPEPWSEALFAGELDVHAALRNWIVVRAQSSSGVGNVVGFGGMMFVADEGHLMNIAIAPEFQGNGLATELLAHLTSDAISRGCKALTLEVRTTNEPACALYRRFGYSPVGVRKGYYVDGADALIMWVHDVDLPEYAQRVASLTPTISALSAPSTTAISTTALSSSSSIPPVVNQ